MISEGGRRVDESSSRVPVGVLVCVLVALCPGMPLGLWKGMPLGLWKEMPLGSRTYWRIFDSTVTRG